MLNRANYKLGITTILLNYKKNTIKNGKPS
jgi:hypothetical protein